jgi:hypothetical protein
LGLIALLVKKSEIVPPFPRLHLKDAQLSQNLLNNVFSVGWTSSVRVEGAKLPSNAVFFGFQRKVLDERILRHELALGLPINFYFMVLSHGGGL